MSDRAVLIILEVSLICGLIVLFAFGGHTATVLGVIWVIAGLIAFLIALVWHFPDTSAMETFEQAVLVLLLGYIGLSMALVRIYIVSKKRTTSA